MLKGIYVSCLNLGMSFGKRLTFSHSLHDMIIFIVILVTEVGGRVDTVKKKLCWPHNKDLKQVRTNLRLF